MHTYIWLKFPKLLESVHEDSRRVERPCRISGCVASAILIISHAKGIEGKLLQYLLQEYPAIRQLSRD